MKALERLLDPLSIAIIGASADAGPASRRGVIAADALLVLRSGG